MRLRLEHICSYPDLVLCVWQTIPKEKSKQINSMPIRFSLGVFVALINIHKNKLKCAHLRLINTNLS